MIKKHSNGININYIKTNKFKHVQIVVSFISKYDPQTFNQRSIIENILMNHSRKYGSIEKLNLQLDDLYGASLGADIYTKGNVISNNLYIKFVNQKYYDDSRNMTEEAIELLLNVLYKPKIYAGKIAKKAITKQVEETYDLLESYKQDKTTHAYIEFLKLYYRGDLERIKVFPNPFFLDQLNQDSITDVYNNMILHDELKISVIGDFDIDDTYKIINRKLSKKANYKSTFKKDFEHAKTLNEFMEVKAFDEDLSISRVYLGYHIDLEYRSKDFYTMLMLNLILGGNAQSKLFRKIREEHQIVYYIYSSYVHDASLCYINFECDQSDEDKALDIIKDMVLNLDFTEKEVEEARQYMIKQMRSRMDKIGGMLIFNIINDIEGCPLESEDTIYQIYNSIQIDDLRRVAKLIKLDTIYRYSKAGDVNESH